jgi:hypothetical protein
VQSALRRQSLIIFGKWTFNSDAKCLILRSVASALFCLETSYPFNGINIIGHFIALLWLRARVRFPVRARPTKPFSPSQSVNLYQLVSSGWPLLKTAMVMSVSSKMAGVCWHVRSLRSARATFEVRCTLLKAPNKPQDYLKFFNLTLMVRHICYVTYSSDEKWPSSNALDLVHRQEHESL